MLMSRRIRLLRWTPLRPRKRSTEFLTSAGNFLNNALPIMQADAAMAPLMGEMMLFAVRGYRVGRTLEAAFEEVVQSIKAQTEADAQAAQEPQEPEPAPLDPAGEAQAAKIQQQTEIEGQKGQMQIQNLQQKGQLEIQKGQTEAQKTQIQLQAQVQKLELEKAKVIIQLQELGIDPASVGVVQ